MGFAAIPVYAQASLETFTADQAALIEALIDCIIPADGDPGAKETGVLYYLDKQLTGALSRFKPVYQKGLPLLQQLCRDAKGRPFEKLSSADGVTFLENIERSGPTEAQSFFRLLIEQTMQGFYGAPENGGNRDEASWRMLHITAMFDGHAH